MRPQIFFINISISIKEIDSKLIFCSVKLKLKFTVTISANTTAKAQIKHIFFIIINL
jgi:hypothetical protein